MIRLRFAILLLLASFVAAGTPAASRSKCAKAAAHLSMETEVKYLLPSLSALPSELLEALKTGAPHERVLRRGFVVQEYIPVTPENLRRFITLVNKTGIKFGTPKEQIEFLKPGKAKEIRMMTKSIKIGDRKVVLRQATIKGAGGLSAKQLETPEDLTPAQAKQLEKLFDSLHGEVTQNLWKLYFEPVLTAASNQVVRRQDDQPYSVEVDVFISKRGIEGGPIFINGEIEFEGANRDAAIAEANEWRNNPLKRPTYFGQDLTETSGVKSRDIAANGPPDFIVRALAPFEAQNFAIFNQIAREYLSWADPKVVGLVAKNPNDLLRTTSFWKIWELGGGLKVQIQSDTPFQLSETDLVDLGAHLPGLKTEGAAGSIDLRVEHTFSKDTPVALTQNPGIVRVSANWNQALPADFTHLLYGAARLEWLKRDIYPVHAACVGDPQNGYMLLVGSPGSGKTSLTLNAVSQYGLKVFSGDKTLLTFTPEGELEAIAGTHTITVRSEDINRWTSIKKVKEHKNGDRLTFELSPELYETAPRVKIKKILLVDLNDGVSNRSELTSLSALHTLYPFFIDKQREDILIGGGEAILDGTVPTETRLTLSKNLSRALEKIPTLKMTASLEEVTRAIVTDGIPQKFVVAEPAPSPRAKNILVGVCGIGNGHSSRQLPVIRHLLEQGHRVTVFTYGDGLPYFKRRFPNEPHLTLIEVANPYFAGSSEGLDFEKTASLAKGNVVQMNARAMDRVAKVFGKPDLVISDYELLSAQYAYAKGAPLVTLDQQSKFLTGVFPETLNGTSYKDEQERLSMFFPSAAQRIAVSFFKVPEQRKTGQTVDILPPTIRPEIIAAKGTPKSEKPSIVVYVTAQETSLVGEWTEILKAQLPEGVKAHMFLPRSVPLPESTDQVQFYQHGDSRFDSIFASAHGVVTTAGHNLLSEAMYLEIPVYALPIRLYEQQLNAHVIAEGRFGISEEQLTASGLRTFLQNLATYADNIRKDTRFLFKEPGNQLVLREIDKRLGGSSLRVLANAEPFGFGPAAAIAEIFPHIRSHMKHLAYIGKGHTLDLHRRLPYDRVYDYAASNPAEERARFLDVVKNYDLFITASDFETASWAKEAGLQVVIYDPLTWFWKKIPDQVKQADLYLAQEFVGVRERLRSEPSSFPYRVLIQSMMLFAAH